MAPVTDERWGCTLPARKAWMSAHDPEDSQFLALQELKAGLRRGADRLVVDALMIVLDCRRGYGVGEIRARHGMSEDEFRDARRLARGTLGRMRDARS